MKKTNNKYRNNNNSNFNQIYSLNYKFDSISIAGKISGTALDLIKRYNELAKEAHGNNDYVASETFRQYAEHYRKIVTDINEKKNSQKVIAFRREQDSEATDADNLVSNDNLDADSESVICDNNNKSDSTEDLSFESVSAEIIKSPVPEKKEFKVIEISSTEANKVSSSSEGFVKQRAKKLPRKKDVEEVVAI